MHQNADGEVSPYLTGVRPGEEIELRGSIGGWFVWRSGHDDVSLDEWAMD